MVQRWKRDLAQSTAHTRAVCLRRVLREFEAHGAPHIELPRIRKGPPRAVTARPADISAMLNAAPPWVRLFILLCWQTALRFSEALDVRPNNHNQELHAVSIRTKGGRIRTIPTTPDIDALLAIARVEPGDENTPYVWLLRRRENPGHGWAGTASCMRRAFERARRNAGVAGELRPHDLRRTTATNLYAVSKDLRAVQQYLGHENLASTTHYLAPLTEDQLRGYQELLAFHKFNSEVKQ